MEKKAQVTAFIVLGLIILIFAGFGIYFYISGQIFTPEIIVPQEVVPVKRAVESCLYQTAYDAIYLAGQQAGYAEVPDEIMLSEHKRLELIPDSGFVVPYWHSNGISRIPTKEEIARNMERVIEKNVNSCINLEAFQEQFNFIEKGEKKATVILNEKDVFVQLNYPLEVQNKQGTKITDLEFFQTNVPKKLLRSYELAKEIMEYENREVFLERSTIDLLSLDPNVPVSDLTFKCERMQWKIDDIKESFRETLRENLRLMRVRNTNYDSFAEPERNYRALERYDVDPTGENIERLQIPSELPSDIYEYKHYFVEATPKKYDDLSVTFRYDKEWPLEMEVRPRQGNILRSNMGKGAVKYFHLLCINFYKFTYDIIYPVLVVIHDDETDFTFQFAFPVQVKSNSPRRENFGFESFEAPQFIEDFCEQKGRKITIRAVDKYLKEERNKVAVAFECAKFYCPLGNTTYQQGRYVLQANLPSGCKPGALVAERSDYLVARKELTGNSEETIEMIPLNDMKLSFVVHESNTGATKSLERNQRIFIYMNDEKLGHEISMIYPDKGDRIKLAEANANYSMEIVLTEGDILKGGLFGNLVYDRNNIMQSSEIVLHVLQKFPEPITVEQQGKLLQELRENKYQLPEAEMK